MRHATDKGPHDYESIPVKLYNLKGSGLRAICISDFPTVGPAAEHMPHMSFASLEKTGERCATVPKPQSERNLAKSGSISSLTDDQTETFKKPFSPTFNVKTKPRKLEW